SIKRVEILSAIQEKLPDAPAVKPEHLGTLHTLRQIAEFLCAGEPAALATGPPTKDTPVAATPGAPVQQIGRAARTDSPRETLHPAVVLAAALGIDSIKRVEILSAIQEKLPDVPAVKPEHLGTLHTLRQIAEFLCAGEPGALATGAPTKETPVAATPGAPLQ